MTPAPASIRLPRAVWFLIILIGGCAASMIAAYESVQILARFLATPTPAATTALAEARELRGYSNELAGLMGEYVDQLPDGGRRTENGFEAWATREFRPRINDLRERMARSSTKAPEIGGLMTAADRAAAMAAHPEDPALRRRAIEEALRATSAAEKRIAGLGVPPYLLEPAVVPVIRRSQ